MVFSTLCDPWPAFISSLLVVIRGRFREGTLRDVRLVYAVFLRCAVGTLLKLAKSPTLCLLHSLSCQPLIRGSSSLKVVYHIDSTNPCNLSLSCSHLTSHILFTVLCDIHSSFHLSPLTKSLGFKSQNVGGLPSISSPVIADGSQVQEQRPGEEDG